MKQTHAALAAIAGVALFGCIEQPDPAKRTPPINHVVAASKDRKREIKAKDLDPSLSPDTARTTDQVKNSLGDEDGLDASNIAVVTIGSTVELKGSVPTEDERIRAQQNAQEATGQSFVVRNELFILPNERE